MLGRASPGIVRIWALPRLTRLMRALIDWSSLCGILQRRAGDDGPHQRRLDREAHGERSQKSVGSFCAGASLTIRRASAAIRWPIRRHSSQVGRRASSRAGGRGLVEVAVVGRDHAALGAVHEQAPCRRLRLDLVAERADEVGADDADVVAEDLGMDGVVDQRGDGLALRVDRLDDAHAGVVESGA